jgi:hypothetical protein
MRKSLKLFFIGVGLSFLISLSEVLELQTLPHDPVEYFIYSISFSGAYMRLLYYSLLVVVIPFMTIPQLKEKLSKRTHYAYVLLSGITFGFSIVGIYTVFTYRIFV